MKIYVGTQLSRKFDSLMVMHIGCLQDLVYMTEGTEDDPHPYFRLEKDHLIKLKQAIDKELEELKDEK